MTTLKTLSRRFLAPLFAAALVVSVGAYEFAKPASAGALAPAPAAPALDSSSVSALLSLDEAMEALASRVTPARQIRTTRRKLRRGSPALFPSHPDTPQPLAERTW